MAGKFINTTHQETIESLVDSMKGIMNNPYYKWQNKTPTIVTYYSRNIEKSTLDEGIKIEQSPYGPNSPIKYNKIKDFYLYGIEQIQVQIENGEFGAQASAVTGEAIVLPNSIIPVTGDYFVINYVKENIVFAVTGVSFDTLEIGSNIYKITYELDTINEEDLSCNIAESYDMIFHNNGTRFETVVRTETYNLVKKLDSVSSYLKDHFINIYYSDRIQSFCFLYNDCRFYDPYMIEFLIKNKILDGTDNYIYINHQLQVPQTFAIQYNKSIFGFFEKEDFANISRYKYKAIGRAIQSRTNIFSNRPEQYWAIDFNFIKAEEEIYTRVPCFKDDFIMAIMDNKLLSGNDAIYNIILKYIEGKDILESDIEDLECMEYCNNPTAFYAIPLIIYCLDRIIIRSMSKPDNQ